MKPELKAKWIEALRSGKYKQGKKALRTKDDCFCCLGVLADVIDPNAWKVNGKMNHIYFWGDGDLGGILPHEISNTFKNKQANYIKANDDYNRTFEEIADIVEKLE